MAYTTKKYVDQAGLRRFKTHMDAEIADMISDATEASVAEINYNTTDNHALTVTTPKGVTTVTTADIVVTENSNNLVTSGAVYSVIGDVETLLAAI